MHRLKVKIVERKSTYLILIECGALGSLGGCMGHICEGRQVLVISDKIAGPLYASRVCDALMPYCEQCDLLELPTGESQKSLASAERIYDMLVKKGFARDGLLVAVGGGVIGDLTGFVAATYLRGMDYIQIPTTLLAQVDASIGGKTAINHSLGKNLIGAFHHPVAVLIDPETLRSLPQREINAGLAEIIKIAVVRDPQLFLDIEQNLDELTAGDLQAISTLIPRSCKRKIEIVQVDERECELRILLNFGHSIAHALEAALDYQTLLHGEAVFLGMKTAVLISEQRGILHTAVSKRINRVLDQFVAQIPHLPAIETERLVQHLRHDKKRRNTKLQEILLYEIGSPLIIDDLSEVELANVCVQIEEERHENAHSARA